MWFKDITIVLGSGSPRRKELVENLGLSLIQDIRSIDETIPEEINALEAAEYLAVKKSEAFSSNELKEGQVLVTADTVVLLNGEILNKPSDQKEAQKMLKNLSNKVHQVITGVSIKTKRKHTSFSVSTEVWFNTLSDTEIDYYIRNFEPYDKAGAYGIQEWIGKIGIAKINGCFYNVMGLPTSHVFKAIMEITKK